MSADEVFSAEIQATAEQEFTVRLKPKSHPELGEILIEENLFPIGRNEPPFGSYDREIVAELSRRHARIFWEGGALYVADLGSKNGTTVNGGAVHDKPCRLYDRDELGLGGTLTYRVQITARAAKPRRAGTLLSLTLTPARDDLGLQPIVIARFPFLISKADEVFARYKEASPHQVNYVSRRHAHIFLKGGAPFVEDLGSTNGTFVGGVRLDEHAVELRDGDVLGFAGSHFVYTVSLERELETEPTLTKFSALAEGAVDGGDNADRTTFIAAADSFLDIFCIDPAPVQDELNNEAVQGRDDHPGPANPREQRRAVIFLRELGKAFAGSDGGAAKLAMRWGIPALALLVVIAAGVYFAGSGERELKGLVADGDYARAVTVADEYLTRDPDDATVKALGTEALLKARLPEWLGSLKAGGFDRAAAILADMKTHASHNADAQALLGELEWIGALEQFMLARGGADAPIRIYADEDKIKALLQRWNADAKGHQRALAQIAAQVPEFKEIHAEALTDLRKLESDESVYLAAVERLNASIATELGKDQPETLDAVLNEYAEKYPRLAGLDRLREDLRQYLALDSALRARALGPLIAALEKTRFATPPFQDQFGKLGATRLPSPEVVNQYRAASRAWHEGNAEQALAGLQGIATGPWADVAASQLEHKKVVQQQFKELQQARGGKDYDERLLAFYASLDADEDVWFVRATETEVRAYRDKALARAHELVNRAQALWRQYRDRGGIGGEHRLESGISGAFRAQARLLSDAQAEVQQGMRIYKLLNADVAAQWTKVEDEITAEAELQRRSLQELHMVLEPGLLKAKLALIGGRSDEERK
ncbi:FHA domain-containing protein [Aromatoleum diolicum]|uniref:FHA domain-containing protein n=1 Tax=Aromatoleum diolicum TaxID=75796 RepID=A0ABX1QIL8_9RHOO|nr:FHA domain-containing protein [Aromatoleum diolicum]NMG77457.1 FHA domain-containing protein [Aromatoleum diolicum]